MDGSHHVVFRFRLPPVLMLRAEPGEWPRTARGVTLHVKPDGAIAVTSIDHSETFGRRQVLGTAARFLRAIEADAPMTTLAAELSAPSCRARPERYTIALGARVSITRARYGEGALVA